MFKLINIILCFLLFFASDQATAQDNFKIFVPEFIPSNGIFEVAIITSKKFPEADKLDIYFLPDFSLNINKVELWVHDVRLQIPVKAEFITEYSEQFQKYTVDFSDSSHFRDETYFQIVLTLKSTSINSNSLKFYGEFIDEEGILGYLENSENKISSNIPNQFNLSFNYYKKYLTAENAAALSQNSYLNIPLIYNFDEVLSVEFWLKAKNYNSTFLKIVNWETNWAEYYLAINENQMLIINSKDHDLFQTRPFFISQNIWYHFNINFDKRSNELSFLCSGEELVKFKITNYIDFDNLVLHFQNDMLSGEFNLDQLRLVNLDDAFTSITRNRNYSDYSDESSNVIFQMNFSETELNSLLNQKIISYEKIKLVKSDAPLYPRAPEIRFKLLDNFYEIEWNSRSYKDVDHFVLERAIGSGDFIEVGSLATNNIEGKTYSILSEKNDQNEIVYFRIKQVNKDGSEVYSDVVKVGQGIIDDLIVGQNYPNPFNPTTIIDFELLQDSDVEIKVYDLAGKEVALIHSGFLSSGKYQFKFDGTGLTSGIYLYQITTLLSSQTKKMILAK